MILIHKHMYLNIYIVHKYIYLFNSQIYWTQKISTLKYIIILTTTTMSLQSTSAWVCLLQGNERRSLESNGRDNPNAIFWEMTKMTSSLQLAQMFLTSKTAHKFPAVLNCSYLRRWCFIYDRVRWSCALRTASKKPGESTISYRTANHGHLVAQHTNWVQMDQGNILSLGVPNRKLYLAHFCLMVK